MIVKNRKEKQTEPYPFSKKSREFCLKYKNNPSVNIAFFFLFAQFSVFSVMASYLLPPSFQISPWHHLTHQLSVTSVFLPGDSPPGTFTCLLHSELVALKVCSQPASCLLFLSHLSEAFLNVLYYLDVCSHVRLVRIWVWGGGGGSRSTGLSALLGEVPPGVIPRLSISSEIYS